MTQPQTWPEWEMFAARLADAIGMVELRVIREYLGVAELYSWWSMMLAGYWSYDGDPVLWTDQDAYQAGVLAREIVEGRS